MQLSLYLINNYECITFYKFNQLYKYTPIMSFTATSDNIRTLIKHDIIISVLENIRKFHNQRSTIQGCRYVSDMSARLCYDNRNVYVIDITIK